MNAAVNVPFADTGGEDADGEFLVIAVGFKLRFLSCPDRLGRLLILLFRSA